MQFETINDTGTITGIFGQPATVREALDNLEAAREEMGRARKQFHVDRTILADSAVSLDLAEMSYKLAVHRLLQTIGVEQ